MGRMSEHIYRADAQGLLAQAVLQSWSDVALDSVTQKVAGWASSLECDKLTHSV